MYRHLFWCAIALRDVSEQSKNMVYDVT